MCSFVLHILFAAGLCTLSGNVCCELLVSGRRGGEHCVQGMTSYLCGGRREVVVGGRGGVTIVLVQFADQWYLGRLLELLWPDGSVAKSLFQRRAQK